MYIYMCRVVCVFLAGEKNLSIRRSRNTLMGQFYISGAAAVVTAEIRNVEKHECLVPHVRWSVVVQSVFSVFPVFGRTVSAPVIVLKEKEKKIAASLYRQYRKTPALLIQNCAMAVRMNADHCHD